MRIWDKKIMEMTIGDSVKVSLWLTLIGALIGAVPFAIATAIDDRNVLETPEIKEIKTEDEDEE